MAHILPVQVDRGSGPVVVLLHGLGNNYKSWSFVLDHLNDSVRVIALDLLGFGDAPKPSLDYTPADHANAVIATLESLRLEDALLVGHSMGCIVAVEVASRRPDLVKQLLLAGAPVYQRAPHASFVDTAFHTQGIYFSIFNIIKKNPEAMKAGGTIADELVPFVKGMEITDATWPAYCKSLEHTIMQYTTYTALKQLKIPTLFLNGLFDLFIIRRVNKRAARANRRYLRTKLVLGPHELTPRQGKRVAKVILHLATKA